MFVLNVILKDCSNRISINTRIKLDILILVLMCAPFLAWKIIGIIIYGISYAPGPPLRPMKLKNLLIFMKYCRKSNMWTLGYIEAF